MLYEVITLKNNFAVIRGLLGLQADSMTDPVAAEAFMATEARVQSMALLYEKLYESARFSEASMADYLPSLVRDVVANYAHAADVRVETDVADVRLDAKRLQARITSYNVCYTKLLRTCRALARAAT